MPSLAQLEFPYYTTDLVRNWLESLRHATLLPRLQILQCVGYSSAASTSMLGLRIEAAKLHIPGVGVFQGVQVHDLSHGVVKSLVEVINGDHGTDFKFSVRYPPSSSDCTD